jgi:triphosphoribosyl-dephospho-CoA synthase
VTRTAAQDAQLALLVEVAGTPKPGNVDRRRDLADLRFEQFLAGAVGAADGLRAAEDRTPVGNAFELAVAGMSDQSGGNTQFGALLLLVPLTRAAADGDLSPAGITDVVEATTVGDAAAFYRAFEHVDVAVGEPPADVRAPDVRRGSGATAALEERDLTLFDVLADSAAVDDVAREWTTGFERSFRIADELGRRTGPVTHRAAAVFLDELAREPDTHVAKVHDDDVARRVVTRAQEAREGGDPALVEAFADALVDEGINPGTTADLVAAGLFVALRRGVEV